jgi:hypothetical protein
MFAVSRPLYVESRRSPVAAVVDDVLSVVDSAVLVEARESDVRRFPTPAAGAALRSAMRLRA